MSNTENNRSWHPGAQIAVGADIAGEHVIIGLQGESGSMIRLQPQQALALATAIRATARRLTKRGGGDDDE